MSSIRPISCILICIRPWYALSVQQVFNGLPSLYDPMDIAYANTEYQTHFLNLAYTPHKAISMKIAAEAARSLKRGESYGSYPQDTLFGDGFRVSYTEDLSELNNGKKFYYSNHTNTRPKDASQLISIAGGSSPIYSL